MNKLNFSPVLAATVVATACTHPDQALAQGTLTFTNTSVITASGNGSHATVAISPDIPNADELLSISGGTLSGGESGAFTVDVQYADTSSNQIYSGTWSGFGPGYALNTMPSESFTPGDVTGLIFNLSNTGFGTPALSIPAGTVFTFEVTTVPEPASVALFALGGAGLWTLVRRKAK